MSKKALRIFLGTLFLFLGLAGLLLPILQGVLFLALGALILSVDIPVFARMACWLEKRSPKIKGVLGRIRGLLGAEECDGQGSKHVSSQVSPRR